MTYKAELVRRYKTREEAALYLASRGFLHLPSGWANGRWSATIEFEGGAFVMTIRLHLQKAA